MSHLTEEQFEDILQGRAEAPGHVDRCPQCRRRLDEKRALARRVSQAFSSIRAGAELAGRIRAEIAAGTKAQPHVLPLRARRHIWSGVAIAAAVLIIAIPRSLQVHTSSGARAAQTALAGIHRTNLDSLAHLMADEGLHKQCHCMASEMNGTVAMPCCTRGLCTCGCQMRDFQGRVVPSCVIEKPDTAPISVVLVPEVPEALGMTLGTGRTGTGQAIWHAACGTCNMASVRMGAGSCCVIGDVPPESLVALLNAFEQ